jgi:hypothetical protein
MTASNTTFRPAVRWFLDDAQGLMPSSEESIRMRRLRTSIDRLVPEYLKQSDQVDGGNKNDYTNAGIELAKALERLDIEKYYDLNDLIDRIQAVKNQVATSLGSNNTRGEPLHRALRETLTALIVVAKVSDRIDLKRRILELIETDTRALNSKQNNTNRSPVETTVPA